jgi:hypothetical protein
MPFQAGAGIFPFEVLASLEEPKKGGWTFRYELHILYMLY